MKFYYYQNPMIVPSKSHEQRKCNILASLGIFCGLHQIMFKKHWKIHSQSSLISHLIKGANHHLCFKSLFSSSQTTFILQTYCRTLLCVQTNNNNVQVKVRKETSRLSLVLFWYGRSFLTSTIQMEPANTG